MSLTMSQPSLGGYTLHSNHNSSSAGRDSGENEVVLTTGDMSGVFSDQGVELALDGNLTSFAHTTASDYSWIRVEFEEVSPVFLVKIINR